MRTLRQLGIKVIGLDVKQTGNIVGSVADRSLVQTSARENGVAAVVHAGALHAPHASHHHVRDFQNVNVSGTANVLSLHLPTVFTSTTSHTITNSVKKREKAGECVWFSSSENAFLSQSDDPPRNKYGLTKRAAEQLCLSAARERQDEAARMEKVSEEGVQKLRRGAVVVLRAPRFFCEDVRARC